MKRDETQIDRIIEEISFILESVKEVDKTRFLKDLLLQHAIAMSLITIGECANHLSDGFKEKHSGIEWLQIIAVRNIAAHGYWQLNMEQIWQAVIEDVPKLKTFFNNL